MKTLEDEAFDDLARKQGAWGGGFKAKQAMAADKLQEPSITRPCRSCNGTGNRDTGIPESPIATCKPCNGTGQIALAQPAQEPVCDKDPQGCWNVRCQLGKQCKNLAQPAPGYCKNCKDYTIEEPLPAQPAQEPVPLYVSKPALESWRGFASDYERGFIDGMQKQAQSSVDKAVNQMAQPAQEPVACARCKDLEEQAYDLLGQLKAANLKWSVAHPWVGLTAEDFSAIKFTTEMRFPAEFRAGARWAEVKLKDKNT